MKMFWIPSTPNRATVEIEHSPFEKLHRRTRAELMGSRSVPAAERRLQVPTFVEMFQWEAMRLLLPLQLPTPGAAPVSASVSLAGWNTPSRMQQ